MRNIGWSLGSFCPFQCTHCYSRPTRNSQLALQRTHVDRIIAELSEIGITGVTLGGNEPIYTSGPDVRASLLPYILDMLGEAGIRSALISSGPTFAGLLHHFPLSLDRCSVFAVSLDSAFKEEHNENRGARLFELATKSIRQLQDRGKEVCILYCLTAKNCSRFHLDALANLCAILEAPLRINTYKHSRKGNDPLRLEPEQYWRWYEGVIDRFETIICSEPALLSGGFASGVSSGPPSDAEGANSMGRPCGSKSFRIGNITPRGRVPITPCMYRTEYYTSDLLTEGLFDILAKPSFVSFDRSKQYCNGCMGNAEENDGYVTDNYVDTDREIRLGDASEAGPYKIFDNYICTWMGRLR